MSRIVRVGSPEKHGRRWRVAEIDATGRRQHRDFGDGPDAEVTARAYVAIFRDRAQARSVASAVTDYIDHLRRHGGVKRRPITDTTARVIRSKLEGILRLVDQDLRRNLRGSKRPDDLPIQDRPLSSLTPSVASALYRQRIRDVKANGDPISPDTHRSELVYASAFGAWCAEQGWIRANPFADVLPEGDLSKGKPQLRLDEARRFIQTAYADQHPMLGVAAAGVLTLGVRSNELLDRRVRDVDDGGKLLWIPFGKTENARRRVVLPPVLRAAIGRLIEGQGPDAHVFGTLTDGTLLKHVKRLCERAGVPEVCTHGLRGTHLSLSVEVSGNVERASRHAGHGSTGVTRAHYLAAGVEESARAMLLEEILLSTPDPEAEARRIAEAEAELRAAQARLEALRKVQLPLGTSGHGPYPTGLKGTPSN